MDVPGVLPGTPKSPHRHSVHLGQRGGTGVCGGGISPDAVHEGIAHRVPRACKARLVERRHYLEAVPPGVPTKGARLRQCLADKVRGRA